MNRMQIESSQPVWRIAAAGGLGQDYSQGRGFVRADVVMSQERRLAEQFNQGFVDDPLRPVQAARAALLEGKLQTESAIADAAEAILRRGV